MIDYEQKAKDLFLRGYNCAQSVFAAFCDKTGISEDTALRLSSSFGGGMGRLREVCGAVSGMFMVAGVLYGYSDPDDTDAKAAHYEKIRALAKEFSDMYGTIICRELLGESSAGTPSPRNEKFYQTRPCIEYVAYAAKLTEDLIKEKVNDFDY